MQVSLEDLYALLQADMFKGFYDGAAGFVDFFVEGTEAANGLNIVLPLVAAGVAAVAAVIKKVGAAGGIGKMFAAHPIGAVITALGALVTLITTASALIASATETAAEKLERLNEKINDMESAQNSAKPLVDSFTTLSQKAEKTTEDYDEMESVLRRLSETSWNYRYAVGDVDTAMKSHQKTAEALAQTYGDVNDKLAAFNAEAARTYVEDKNNFDEAAKALRELAQKQAQEGLFKELLNSGVDFDYGNSDDNISIVKEFLRKKYDATTGLDIDTKKIVDGLLGDGLVDSVFFSGGTIEQALGGLASQL